MSKLPPKSRTFRAIVNAQGEEQKRQRSTSPFADTGMSPDGLGGTVTDGPLEVNGRIDVHGAATFDGATSIGGNLSVVGTLSLPAGIIGNDSLTSPVVPSQAFQGANSFVLTVAGSNIITISRTVPAGFTSVIVNAYGRVAAINSTASLDALYCAVDVNGVGGNQFGNEVNAGSFGSLSAGYSTVLTGLSAGDPVATHIFASTSAASWAANAANGADLSVTYLWFR